MTRRIGLLALVLMALVGCRFPAAVPAPLDAPGRLAAVPEEPQALSGQVSFPQRTTQATLTDVAIAATVSLIDTGTNQTVATTLTNASGQFLLTFARGFRPEPTATYYLEAVKGLDDNRPGSYAARVRTIARYQNGWLTITNASPNGGVVLNAETSALSIGAALRNGNPSPFDFATLLGSLTVASPSAYAPVPNLSQADYAAVLDLVEQALTANQDPVAGVGLTLPSSWRQLNATLSLTNLSPASGSVGAAVVASGTGFSTTPSNDVVRFNGVAATVTAATGTRLDLTVPAGATSGQTTVQVGNLIALGPIFSVETVVSGLSPASGGSGTSVTITGSGFDPSVLANNAVTFSGVPATVTAVTATSLTATVPTGATTGPVAVTVAGSTGTSGSNFVVPVAVSGFSPSSGGAGTTVTIAGSGFSSTAADNSVSFNGVSATVTSASATSLTATAPASTTGPIAVTVAGQTGTSGSSYTYVVPRLTALYQPLTNTGNTMILEGSFGSSATVNFPGGVSAAATVLGANRAQVTVPAGATAGSLTVTTAGTTTAALPFRNASFGLGLQPFNSNYEQANTPRIRSSLVTARYGHTSAVIGNHLYVVGGWVGSYTTSVERAPINSDGTIGTFSTVAGVTLVTARTNHTSAVIGNYLYVIGGWNGTNLSSVERATINPDGTLGAFSTVPGVTLVAAGTAGSSEIIGDYLYVIRSDLNKVERATISADGTIGTFATVPGVTFETPRQYATSTVIGTYLYVIGGSGGGPYSNVVERATIGADGTLGTFSTVAGVTLVTARYGHTSAVIGNTLYIMGGTGSGGDTNNVERATINPDGTLGAFSTVTGGAMGTARGYLSSAVIGNHLYVVGGQNGATILSSVERAAINANGNLGTFATDTSTLPAARYGHTSAVIGTYLYVIGGYNNSSSSYLNSVERAAINADGTIGTFSTVAGVTLVTARYGHTSAVIGNYLYVIGGNNGGVYLNSVERAPINADGAIGTFSTVSGVTLVTARDGHTSAVIGNYLYVMGGYGIGTLSSVERAPINADGTIGSFSTVSGVALVTGRQGHTSAVIGNYLYVMGGRDGSGSALSSVERAPINADGTIGTFSTVPGVTLATACGFHTSAVIGNYLYVIGGYNAGTPLSSVERAVLQ